MYKSEFISEDKLKYYIRLKDLSLKQIDFFDNSDDSKHSNTIIAFSQIVGQGISNSTGKKVSFFSVIIGSRVQADSLFLQRSNKFIPDLLDLN